MDIQATKPVSSVPAPREVDDRPAPAVVALQAGHIVPVDVQKPAPVRDLHHTLAVVAEQLREYLRSTDRDLEFRVDSDAATTVITVRDAGSGDVIRQIPNEEALRIMRRLNANSGTLIDLTA